MPGDLHVLLLPSWYPTARNPLNGIFFKEQAEALAEAGVKVGVLHSEMRSLRQLGFRSVLENHYQITSKCRGGVCTYQQAAWNVPSRKAKRKYVEVLTRRLFTKYVAEHGKPDLIHVHSALWAGVAAMDIKKRYGIPYVVTEHSTAYARKLLSHYELQLAGQVFINAEKRMAVSSRFARLLETIFPGTTFDVVPNMVDTDFFSCGSPVRTQKPFVFLSVAFLTAKKGIDILLEAFAKAFRDIDDVKLEIGGDGDQKTALEQKMVDLGITKQVTFLGALSRSQVRDAMCRSNVFVLPSYYETFGVVLIEAMATGLPVVATRSGGPEDIVNPEVGFLVEPGNIEELAEALRRMKDNYNTFMSRMHMIREIVAHRYSREVVVERLLACYESAKSTIENDC